MNVNTVIGGLEDLVGKSLTSKVAIETDLGADLWSVRVDSGDFEDALVNLSINARDAMPKGGRLIFETRNVVLDLDFTDRKELLEPGDYVEISISDTGTGMPKEIANKIFAPFFTTKGVGQGTGLGLAMVRGFVERSRGCISVYSEEGIGTTFKIYLPRTLTMNEGKDQLIEIEKTSPRGTETILIVDDEEDLASVAEEILQGLGYQTICAHNGDDALAVLKNGSLIDLMFSDVVMPGSISGFDLAETASKMYPELKIVLTSGFTGKLENSKESEKWSRRLIRKPYRNVDLANRVRTALDEAN